MPSSAGAAVARAMALKRIENLPKFIAQTSSPRCVEVLFWRRYLLRLPRHKVRHAAAPDPGGGLVAMADGVRLEKGHAVGVGIGASPSHVTALALAVVAQQASPDRIDRLAGVDVGEEARVIVPSVADIAHLDI